VPSAVSVSGVTKRFSADVLAVDNLSFSVAPGQVCGLLGPNGAGKTTTLRILLGLVHPTAGATSILGEPAGPGAPVLARVGSIVEGPAFVPHLSGLANLRMFWEAGGGPWPAPGLDEGLALADLGKAVDRRVKTYSHGMRQRLGLAQALLGRPEVLVLDEPTNGLDPQEMREIRRLLRDLSGGGATVLLSSHLLSEVEQVCSHAVVINRGRLVAAGTVGDLVGASASVYVEVDDPVAGRAVLERMRGVRAATPEPPGFAVELDGVTRPQLVARLVRAGVGVETVVSRHRLEDAFVDLLDQGDPR
jgi:ABC-2 type transport system ATP-binding protein